MITTKYNFKLWLHKKYPHITATPIYGLPAYILSQTMNAQDNFMYNTQQLPDGRYVVFVGCNPATIRQLMQQLKEEGVPKADYRSVRTTAPTTFASFQMWLDRHDITPLNRTFCANDSEANLFKDETRSTEKRAWYMYEIPLPLPQPHTQQDEEKVFENVPHTHSVSTTLEGLKVPVIIVLIKASTSRYKSKKQRFIEKFDLMQPLYEKLIADCAKAQFMEERGEPADTEWNEAVATCEQYMGILFEREGHVEIKVLKEAAHEGSLGLFTRDPERLVSDESDQTSF